jgi:hypothetical protein
MLRCGATMTFNEILPKNGLIVEKLLRVETSATVTGPWSAGEYYRVGGAEFLLDFRRFRRVSRHDPSHLSSEFGP